MPLWVGHWNSPWLYSCAVHKLCRVGWDGVQKLLHSCRLIPYEGSAPPKTDKRMTQYRDPGGCSSSYLPRATIPNYAHTTCPSCPLGSSFAGAYGKWLWMKFYVLSLSEHICLFSRLCLFMEDINSTAFHSHMLCEHLLSTLILWAWEPDLVFRTYISQGWPLTTEIYFWNFTQLCPSYQSMWLVL